MDRIEGWTVREWRVERVEREMDIIERWTVRE